MIASPIQSNDHRPLAEAREVIADRNLKFALNRRMINKHEGGDDPLYAHGFENEEPR